jgi:CheY-like chemotaxis protein
MSGPHVLYVDDEPALVALSQRWLQRSGYHVSGYHDPAEALASFQLHPHDYDVVVTDLSMPLISGFTLALALRELRADLRIILMSGFLTPQDEERCRTLCVHEVLLKPFRLEKLLETLDALFPERARS